MIIKILRRLNRMSWLFLWDISFQNFNIFGPFWSLESRVGSLDAGRVVVRFNDIVQYRLYNCYSSYANFPTTLPAAKDKVWRITITRTSGIRLVIHCNEEEVLNILMSNLTCSKKNWSQDWSQDVAWILFSSSDDASDYYRFIPKLPTGDLFWEDILLSFFQHDGSFT